MNKKLTCITKLANHTNFEGFSIGNRLNYIAERVHTYVSGSLWSSVDFKDSGRLELKNAVMTFCYDEFAKMFGMRVAEAKKLFPPNTIHKVRITVEVLESEEWEYTKDAS